jgi:hypothetical protein
MSAVISISTCSFNVNITPCVPTQMGCGNFYTFTASSDYIVNTNVTVNIFWNGDLGGFEQGTVTIFFGSSCNSTSVYTSNINCIGEFASSVFSVSSPSSSGNQTYVDVAPIYNLCPC